jgi:hypothetical protein
MTTHPRFAPTGHIVFARVDSLWEVPGRPVAMTDPTGGVLLEAQQPNITLGLGLGEGEPAIVFRDTEATSPGGE